MKFKVGDKVRVTREFIANNGRGNIRKEFIIGTKVEDILNDGFIKIGGNAFWSVENLELVPEEPEFEYGEEIEVQARGQDEWFKAIFICKIPGKYRSPYVCVEEGEKDNFKNGERYEIVKRDFARKLKPQLTRKEIAEKFGVSEDFTLVE